MVDFLRTYCDAAICEYKKDPLTDEPVEFLPAMGTIRYNDTEITIGTPKPLVKPAASIHILPYSFIFFEKDILEADFHPDSLLMECTFTGSEIHGAVFFCLIK